MKRFSLCGFSLQAPCFASTKGHLFGQGSMRFFRMMRFFQVVSLGNFHKELGIFGISALADTSCLYSTLRSFLVREDEDFNEAAGSRPTKGPMGPYVGSVTTRAAKPDWAGDRSSAGL